jgi:hypothetical protein
MMASFGGKLKDELRAATPIEFRDLLLSIASSAFPPSAPLVTPR